MNDPTKQQIRKYKIDWVRLIKGRKHSMYVHEDILIPILMQSRLSGSKTINCRSDAGFSQINLILKKERSVIESIRDTFKWEDIQIQYTVLSYKIDLYFYEHKLEIQVDELGHNDRNTDYESKRQREIENELNYVFIRTNPDAIDFNINELNNQIFNQNKKMQKIKWLIKLLKTLKNSCSDKIKRIKTISQKHFTKLKRIEKHTIKDKTDQN